QPSELTALLQQLVTQQREDRLAQEEARRAHEAQLAAIQREATRECAAAEDDGDVRDDYTALHSHRTRPAAARTARPSGHWSTSACSYSSSSSYCSSSYYSDTGDHVLDVSTSWVCRSSAVLATASDHTLPGLTVDSRSPRRSTDTTFRGRRRGVPTSAVDTAGNFSTHYVRC